METETLTIKFDGQDHQVDIQTFVYSVLNFSTVVKEANKKNGGGIVNINIKAPEKGSLIVHLVTNAINDPHLLSDLADGATILTGTITAVGLLYKLHQFISGKKVASVGTVDNSTTITLEDGSTLVMAENVYYIYNTTPAIPDAISKNFSALSEDPAVTSFEVKTGDKKIIEIPKEDYARMAIKQQIETATNRIITESAIIYISKIVFENSDRKWEFYYSGNKISANIVDEEFYQLIDGGESFAKGDQLRVDLRVTQVLDESIGTYVNSSYAVIKVHEHIKRTEQPQLPFDIEETSDTTE